MMILELIIIVGVMSLWSALTFLIVMWLDK